MDQTPLPNSGSVPGSPAPQNSNTNPLPAGLVANTPTANTPTVNTPTANTPVSNTPTANTPTASSAVPPGGAIATKKSFLPPKAMAAVVAVVAIILILSGWYLVSANSFYNAVGKYLGMSDPQAVNQSGISDYEEGPTEEPSAENDSYENSNESSLSGSSSESATEENLNDLDAATSTEEDFGEWTETENSELTESSLWDENSEQNSVDSGTSNDDQTGTGISDSENQSSERKIPRPR